MIKKLLQVGILFAVFVSIPAGATPMNDVGSKAEAREAREARKEARVEARKEARVEARKEARVEARKEARKEARVEARIASRNGSGSKPPVSVSEPGLVGLLAMGLIAIGIARRLVRV